MWAILTTDRFDVWFDALNDKDRANVLASLIVLRTEGPLLERPYADTVYGSKFTNMKELRIQSNGKALRILFAFDPDRTGILLCAGTKSGKSKSFYHQLISVADKEFSNHLQKLKKR